MVPSKGRFSVERLPDAPFRATLTRLLPSKFAEDPLIGLVQGVPAATRFSGAGEPCLYAADSLQTARAEVLRHVGNPDILPPFTAVSIKVDLHRVLDLSSPEVRSRLGIIETELSGTSFELTQAIGREVRRSQHFEALQFPSNAREGGTNVCIFRLHANSSIAVTCKDKYIFSVHQGLTLTLEKDRFRLRPATITTDSLASRVPVFPTPTGDSIVRLFRERYGLVSVEVVAEFERLLDSPKTKEGHLQRFFEMNPAFLSHWDFSHMFPQVQLLVGEKGIPDFILLDKETAKTTVVELKIPKYTLVRRQVHRDRFGAAFGGARTQLLNYKAWFDIPENRKKLLTKVGVEIYKPRLAVIMGRAREFHSPLDRQQLESQHPDIELLTYDDLLAHVKRTRVL